MVGLSGVIVSQNGFIVGQTVNIWGLSLVKVSQNQVLAARPETLAPTPEVPDWLLLAFSNVGVFRQFLLLRSKSGLVTPAIKFSKS